MTYNLRGARERPLQNGDFHRRVAEVIESNISSDYQAEQISIQVIQLFLTVCERFQMKLSESIIIATQLFATNITNVTSNVQHTLLLSSAVTIFIQIRIAQQGFPQKQKVSHAVQNLTQYKYTTSCTKYTSLCKI